MASVSAVPRRTNYQTITHVIGALIALLGSGMFLPALMDWADGHPHWQVFAGAGFVTTGSGVLLLLASREEAVGRIRIRDGFLLTSLVWLILPFFAALPFLGLGLSFADAFFEAVSGITATGATVLNGLDDMPPGVLFWRALLQWIGGIGIIVMAMVLLPFLGIGGMQLFRAESSDRSEENLFRSRKLVGWIAGVYVSLTIACTASYGAAGMTFFDAICHSFSTVSTAGFSTHDASIAFFDSVAIEIVAVVFMILGALPFVVLIAAVRGNPRQMASDPQIRWFFAFLAIVCALMAVWLTLEHAIPFERSVRLVTFNVISVVTTTGFASTDYMAWGPVAAAAFFALTFVGGCAGSTTGGIKVYRFVVIDQIVRNQFRRLWSPSVVEPLKYGRRLIPEGVPTAVLAFLALYFLSTAVVALALAAAGVEPVSAFSAAATAISNVGPGVGDVIGPAGNFSNFSGTSKTILSFAMILGRLELFTVFVLLDPDFWRW